MLPPDHALLKHPNRATLWTDDDLNDTYPDVADELVYADRAQWPRTKPLDVKPKGGKGGRGKSGKKGSIKKGGKHSQGWYGGYKGRR